jgi:DNA-binding NtrC family response regulator
LKEAPDGVWKESPQINPGKSVVKVMNRKNSILVVDDELNILEVIKARLEYNNFNVDTATSGKDALSLFAKNNYSAILTDLHMPEMDGFDLMSEIRNYDTEIPIIFLTAHSSLEKAVKSIKKGAYNFLEKPLDAKFVNYIIDAVNDYEEKKQKNTEKFFRSLSWNITRDYPYIIAKSQVMKNVLNRIKKVSGCDSTILIHGESGTGKELVARALHSGRIRKKGDFIVVDCGTTHDMLLESELFGHVKGAFTNAHTDKKGLFELADGGTIFLDEVASISWEMQKKLLRVIQEGEIRRVGDTRYKRINVRIISATNKKLSEAVEKGTFRKDLYYRLNVIAIKIPPLRERAEDVPILTDYFLEMFSDKMGKRPKQFQNHILEMMLDYPWPGNVRELRNFVESAVAVSNGEYIDEEDIEGTDLLNYSMEENDDKNDSISDMEDGNLNLELNERKLIVAALEKSNWVQKDAAKLLGINSRVINYRIKKMKIDCKAKYHDYAFQESESG